MQVFVAVLTSLCIGVLAIFILKKSENDSDSGNNPKSTVVPNRAPTTSTISDRQIILDWLSLNRAEIEAFGSAVDSFEGTIMSTANNDAVGRASIILYNALLNLKPMPTYVPYSKAYNVAINYMTVVMNNLSDYALSGDYKQFYQSATEWQDARNLIDAWYASLP